MVHTTVQLSSCLCVQILKDFPDYWKKYSVFIRQNYHYFDAASNHSQLMRNDPKSVFWYLICFKKYEEKFARVSLAMRGSWMAAIGKYIFVIANNITENSTWNSTDYLNRCSHCSVTQKCHSFLNNNRFPHTRTSSYNVHTYIYQWGSYQIDVLSYRCDEHRQKITFWYRFLEICSYMYERQTAKF